MILLKDNELELVAGGGSIVDAIIGWAVGKALDAAVNAVVKDIGAPGESDPSLMYAGQLTA